ncbi:hypothetical protein MRB53_041574 [Persea americana]|nr:hypothetical protein MRB53_041574 [Persea americana]
MPLEPLTPHTPMSSLLEQLESKPLNTIVRSSSSSTSARGRGLTFFGQDFIPQEPTPVQSTFNSPFACPTHLTHAPTKMANPFLDEIVARIESVTKDMEREASQRYLNGERDPDLFDAPDRIKSNILWCHHPAQTPPWYNTSEANHTTRSRFPPQHSLKDEELLWRRTMASVETFLKPHTAPKLDRAEAAWRESRAHLSAVPRTWEDWLAFRLLSRQEHLDTLARRSRATIPTSHPLPTAISAFSPHLYTSPDTLSPIVFTPTIWRAHGPPPHECLSAYGPLLLGTRYGAHVWPTPAEMLEEGAARVATGLWHERRLPLVRQWEADTNETVNYSLRPRLIPMSEFDCFDGPGDFEGCYFPPEEVPDVPDVQAEEGGFAAGFTAEFLRALDMVEGIEGASGAGVRGLVGGPAMREVRGREERIWWNRYLDEVRMAAHVPRTWVRAETAASLEYNAARRGER